MIISHKYKFIFLKTAKTASTSIEIALSKHCGEKDSITPMLSPDEEIRRGLQYRGPQNYLSPITDYTVKEIINLIFSRSEKSNGTIIIFLQRKLRNMLGIKYGIVTTNFVLKEIHGNALYLCIIGCLNQSHAQLYLNF